MKQNNISSSAVSTAAARRIKTINNTPIKVRLRRMRAKLLYPYYLLRAEIAYRRMLETAHKDFLEAGLRVYAIGTPAGNITCVTLKDVKVLKRKGYIDRRTDTHSIQEKCFYRTPKHDGSDPMTQVEQWRAKQRFINFFIRHHS